MANLKEKKMETNNLITPDREQNEPEQKYSICFFCNGTGRADENIVDLKLNDNFKSLYCHNNQIKELKLNDNLISLWCYNIKLKELILNDKLQELGCDINTKLFNIPKTCIIDIYE